MGTSDLYLDWDTLKNLFEMIFALLLLQLVLYNVEARFLPNRDYEVDYRRLPRMERMERMERIWRIWRIRKIWRMRRIWRIWRRGWGGCFLSPDHRKLNMCYSPTHA